DGLGASVVHPGPEDEARTLVQPIDSPAGQATRNLLHVLLSIAAVNSQGVQLEQLARVVLVDSRLALSRRGRRGFGDSRLRLRSRSGFHILARRNGFAVSGLLASALPGGGLRTGRLLIRGLLAGFDILILSGKPRSGDLDGLRGWRGSGG